MGVVVALGGMIAQSAVGVAVAGVIGPTATAVISTAISGAIIGAAVGGLTAAVTGGDIMDGVLFGAVGGAVLGGVSGYFNSGIVSGTAVTQGGQVMGQAGKVVGEAVTQEGVAGLRAAEIMATGGDVGGGVVFDAAGAATGTEGGWIGTAWSKLGEGAQEAVVGGLTDFVKMGIQGGAAEEAAEMQAAEAQKDRDLELQLQRERLAAANAAIEL